MIVHAALMDDLSQLLVARVQNPLQGRLGKLLAGQQGGLKIVGDKSGAPPTRREPLGWSFPSLHREF